MNIFWYGFSCIRIETKTAQGDASLVTDPFDAKAGGLKLPRALKTDIGLLSAPVSKETREIFAPAEEGKDVFFIDSAGEFEKSGIFVSGFRAGDDPRTIYMIEAEDIHILYCGALSKPLSDADLEKIENIDILIVPVGGHGVMSGKEAADFANALEPRIVIPVQYHLPGVKEDLDGAEAFIKAMGGKAEEPVAKLKINRKDLPEDTTKIVLLSPAV
ncbi:MAG: MBL fold metallo-hydrolase [Patescibacteria group bacterium]